MSNSNSVDDLRQKGNHEFQQGRLDAALSLYAAGLQLLETQSGQECLEQTIVLLCNCSACHYQLLDYEQALDDAQQAFALSQSQNVKACYRLAKTCLALGEADSALKVLQSPGLVLTEEQENSFKSLKEQAQQLKDQPKPEAETTVKTVTRPLSIREFERPQSNSLGVGNFSEIVACKHKLTGEHFALKILDKKTAADLGKRQHPNVYNEIAMEARVLLKRLTLTPHPYIIQMYHSFQDYTCIYYLMELHNVNKDLWTSLRYEGNMVGTHSSQVKIWMSQMIDALEHIHRYGIVHRDLKPENILLNEKNHVVVIDFGTAKDLIETDLNGPEFVGTPDFMSPEAITGVSSAKPSKELIEKSGNAATHATDLWALGGTMYILLTGSTPFWSPSPYLTFLRIQRGLLPRLGAIWNDDAWDFISKLMQVDASKRLGASVPWLDKDAPGSVKSYQCLHQHPYFDSLQPDAKKQHVIPSLQDLCIRACADLVQQDASDLDLCDAHPPGDGSAHDFTRLSPAQQQAVLHVLEKSKVFKGGDETRVFQRFHDKPVEALQAKVLPARQEFLGLTRMVDDEFKIPSHRGSEDPYATKDKLLEPTTKIVVISNPLLLATSLLSPEDEKLYIQQWKQCISAINKKRPKAVIVCGQQITKKCWKFLARIRDSIPVLWNDGSTHYTFWLNGFQGILLQSSALAVDSNQMQWLSELMEQSRMAKHQVFCFCDCDPRDLSPLVLKRLARGKVVVVIGLSKDDDVDYELNYEPNETVTLGNDDDNDNVSVKSNDSVEDDMDRSRMRVLGTSKNSLRWLTIDEKEDWSTTLEVMVEKE
jgi:serine/threonine protein kinase